MKGPIGKTRYNIIASFEKHTAPVIQAIEINKNIIASIDISGFLFCGINSIQMTMIHVKKMFLMKRYLLLSFIVKSRRYYSR